MAKVVENEQRHPKSRISTRMLQSDISSWFSKRSSNFFVNLKEDMTKEQKHQVFLQMISSKKEANDQLSTMSSFHRASHAVSVTRNNPKRRMLSIDARENSESSINQSVWNVRAVYLPTLIHRY